MNRVARGLSISTLLILSASALAAQGSGPPDQGQLRIADASFTGGRLMKSGIASQFDSLGLVPMGDVGDSVTVYLFPDGDHLERIVHARIAKRARLQPPASWRKACDEIAHPGWLYTLNPLSRAVFAVVVPGVFARPEARPAPAAARAGAWTFFHAVADSSWQRYKAFLNRPTGPATDYMWRDFWREDDSAGYSGRRFFGVRGTEGRTYMAFSFAMRDDYPGYTPNTARTWIVDAWGYPVAGVTGNIDIYGTVDDGGHDAIVTSSGLIRWDGTRWQFPPVYSEEPCLFHQVMDPPAGVEP